MISHHRGSFSPEISCSGNQISYRDARERRESVTAGVTA